MSQTSYSQVPSAPSLPIVIGRCNHIVNTIFYLEYGRKICGLCGMAYWEDGKWNDSDDSLRTAMEAQAQPRQ